MLGATFRDARHAPEMIVLPRGEFVMGAGSKQAPHPMQIDYVFAIGKYAVTFDEYDTFARATGHELPDDEGWGRGNMPVINVSWYDAQGYVQWLGETTGRRYRLPSEAEWEYAARAGTQTIYWWGNFIHITQANYLETPGFGTLFVNSFAPNPWGLYNMHGNVNEWVEDCYHASYVGAPSDGSARAADHAWTGSVDDHARVIRGGCWMSERHKVRSAYREKCEPSANSHYTGFRVATPGRTTQSPYSNTFHYQSG